MKPIDKFEGDYRFLSNFWPCEVEMDGLVFSSTESAYQALKTLDKDMRLKIQNAKTPSEAKKLGRKLILRADWEQIKLSVMEELLRKKFIIPELKQKLLDTGDKELIEGNYWSDFFWGVCRGKGENHLGRLLMKIRAEIK